jgi:hypothetical protein
MYGMNDKMAWKAALLPWSVVMELGPPRSTFRLYWMVMRHVVNQASRSIDIEIAYPDP